MFVVCSNLPVFCLDCPSICRFSNASGPHTDNGLYGNYQAQSELMLHPRIIIVWDRRLLVDGPAHSVATELRDDRKSASTYFSLHHPTYLIDAIACSHGQESLIECLFRACNEPELCVGHGNHWD